MASAFGRRLATVTKLTLVAVLATSVAITGPTAASATKALPDCSKADQQACVDNSRLCQTWVAAGFCTSPFFTPEQRKAYCAKSCGLCDNSTASPKQPHSMRRS